jgi:hypothetical protein
MRRRGNVLAMVVVATTALIGSAAGVIDLAMGYAERARQQSAVDAGALAATHHLVPPADPAAARQAAVAWVGRNGYAIGPDDVSVWSHPSGQLAATVRCARPVETVFARLLGLRSLAVAATASATVGGVSQVPGGWVPFAVPAYRQRARDPWGGTFGFPSGLYPQGGANDWFVKSSPTGGFALLTADPARGGPTRIVLRADDGQTGNFGALGVGSTGAEAFKHHLVDGVATSLPLPSEVATEPGKMAGPTAEGLKERLERHGEAGRKILVPLVELNDWLSRHGRGEVTIIGYASARLDGIDLATNEITATFVSRIVSAKASRDGQNVSPGVYAPMLIATP